MFLNRGLFGAIGIWSGVGEGFFDSGIGLGDADGVDFDKDGAGLRVRVRGEILLRGEIEALCVTVTISFDNFFLPRQQPPGIDFTENR